ncbi:hypothetical protein [Ferruginibacter sp. HRS2-29]|uniref:hypothetical protein n=1 Tax=Ferruginibacter sp. HRS2-29 TaxID=2487334 RepID=UPI0020CBC431|nr:hypothetical protein [Ferruginibacter sp. HRS2-29]MCP9751996.1 hypothetical protein [Ferruginibacter sp. HRS2-29]
MKPIKNLFVKICLAATLMISFFAATAASEPGSAKSNSVAFVKSEGDALVFRTDLLKLPSGGCTLYIKDEEGNVLFSENITTDTHQKLYRINRENMKAIFFEVHSRKFSFRESFNFNTKLEEIFTVTKVN